MSKQLSLRLDLLDRQIVDADELPVGRVDDVVLDVSDGHAPRIVALLTGAQALGERLGHGLGRLMARTAARLRSSSAEPGPARIDRDLVDSIEHQVRLRAPLNQLEHVAGLERWLAEHFIEGIPGSGDARE